MKKLHSIIFTAYLVFAGGDSKLHANDGWISPAMQKAGCPHVGIHHFEKLKNGDIQVFPGWIFAYEKQPKDFYDSEGPEALKSLYPVNTKTFSRSGQYLLDGRHHVSGDGLENSGMLTCHYKVYFERAANSNSEEMFAFKLVKK